jgi:hypothetical protein
MRILVLINYPAASSGVLARKSSTFAPRVGGLTLKEINSLFIKSIPIYKIMYYTDTICCVKFQQVVLIYIELEN